MFPFTNMYTKLPSIVFLGHTSDFSTTGNGTLTLPSHSADDLLIVGGVRANQLLHNLPTGWTFIANNTGSASTCSWVAYKIAENSSETYPIADSSSTSYSTAAMCYAFRYAHLTNPIVQLTSASGTTGLPDPPSLTLQTGIPTALIVGYLSNIATVLENGWEEDNSQAVDTLYDATIGMAIRSTKRGIQTYDPGAFTGTGSSNWRALTIEIRNRRGTQ